MNISTINNIDAIDDTVISEIAEYLSIDPQLINAETTFRDLELDSLALIDMAFRLEDQFGVRIDDNDLKEIDNIGKLTRHLKQLVCLNSSESS